MQYLWSPVVSVGLYPIETPNSAAQLLFCLVAPVAPEDLQNRAIQVSET